jgi:hypothetical protein
LDIKIIDLYHNPGRKIFTTGSGKRLVASSNVSGISIIGPEAYKPGVIRQQLGSSLGPFYPTTISRNDPLLHSRLNGFNCTT